MAGGSIDRGPGFGSHEEKLAPGDERSDGKAGLELATDEWGAPTALAHLTFRKQMKDTRTCKGLDI